MPDTPANQNQLCCLGTDHWRQWEPYQRLVSSCSEQTVLVQAQYPGLLDSFSEFIAGACGKRVAVFLDYDGTLTPIVKNPDKAYMSEQVRCQL